MAQRPAAAAAQPVRGIAQELASIAEEVGLAEHFLVGEMDVNLLEELGRGSDAAVYKARWQGACVAAKVLHPILIQPSNEGRRRKIGLFLRECNVLRGQPHPHVTQCMGVGFSSDGQLLILLELMEATLSSRFTAPEPDSQRQCWVYVRDIAAGLAFLHSRGIIHRDVKPDNCLVRFGHAKLSDVGLARQLDGDDFVARGTRVPGTVMFMPPEAFKDGVPYGKALDVFGIGVTVLCVFIRKTPDRSAYLAPRIQRTDGQEEEIAEVDRRRVDLALLPAHHLSRPTIEQCIANNPDQRPSAEALVDVFEAQLQEVEAEAAAQQREAATLEASVGETERVSERMQELQQSVVEVEQQFEQHRVQSREQFEQHRVQSREQFEHVREQYEQHRVQSSEQFEQHGVQSREQFEHVREQFEQHKVQSRDQFEQHSVQAREQFEHLSQRLQQQEDRAQQQAQSMLTLFQQLTKQLSTMQQGSQESDARLLRTDQQVTSMAERLEQVDVRTEGMERNETTRLMDAAWYSSPGMLFCCLRVFGRTQVPEPFPPAPKWRVISRLPEGSDGGRGKPVLYRGYLYWTMVSGCNCVPIRIALDGLADGQWEDVPWDAGPVASGYGFYTHTNHLYWLCRLKNAPAVTNADRFYRMLSQRNASAPTLFRYTDDTWHVVTQVPGPDSLFVAHGLVGSRFFIAGGQSSSQSFLYSTFSFDLCNESAGWRTWPDVPSCASCPLVEVDGQIHAIGRKCSYGNGPTNVLTLNTDESQGRIGWSKNALPCTPFTRSHASIVNDCVVIAGGQQLASMRQSEPILCHRDDFPSVGSVFVHSRESNEWLPLPCLSVARAVAHLLFDGSRLICLGGFNKQSKSWCKEIEVLQFQ